MSSTGQPPIERLNGRNYLNWKFRMQMELQKLELWDVISEYEDRPSMAQSAKFKAWKRRDDKVMGTITAWCESSQFSYIRNETTAKGMWDKLGEVYRAKGWAWRIQLIKRLFMTRLEPKGSMQDHISSLMETVQSLDEINARPSDDLIIAALFASIPDTYDSLIVSMESHIPIGNSATPNSTAQITVEWVIQRLLAEEARQSESILRDGRGAEAYATAYSKRSNTCFNCGKRGHYAAACPHPPASDSESSKEEKERRQKKKEKVYAAIMAILDDSDSDHAATDADHAV